jgi:DNA-binding HxlR family transcriptional regulator
VPSRSYGHACAVAAALDVVGDRWTLLIVRELLSGPKRYTDLQAGLPGIASDLLASRLRGLEQNEVVIRSTLRPPAASKVYALTSRGAALEPVLLALASWGTPMLADAQHSTSRADWLAIALRAHFRPVTADGPVIVEFHVGSERLRATIRGATLVVGADHDGDADVIVAGSVSSVAALVSDPQRRAAALASGEVRVTGDATSIRVVQHAFGIDDGREERPMVGVGDRR